MDLNPYEQLGVQRDASEALIRKAYREKSKTDHPNANPDADPVEWEKTSTALAVLTDPDRRRTFDETGRVEPEAVRPDNQRAAALTIVEGHVADIVNAYVTGGFEPALDPRAMNIPVSIVMRLRVEIAQAQDGLVGGAKHIDYLKDIGARFKLKDPAAFPEGDPIVRGFKIQVDRAEQQLADLRTSIKVREMAIAIAQGYTFAFDPPVMPNFRMDGGAMVFEPPISFGERS